MIIEKASRTIACASLGSRGPVAIETDGMPCILEMVHEHLCGFYVEEVIRRILLVGPADLAKTAAAARIVSGTPTDNTEIPMRSRRVSIG